MTVYKTKRVERTNAYDEPTYGWSEEELLFRCDGLTKQTALRILDSIDLESMHSNNVFRKAANIAPDFDGKAGYVAFACSDEECIEAKEFKPAR